MRAPPRREERDKPSWNRHTCGISAMKESTMKRRTLLQAMLMATLPVPVLARTKAAAVVEVYKSEGCGCCEGWIEHLKTNGFTVRAQDVGDTGAYRRKFGMPDALGSCHTGLVQGYALEGHVPATEIKRLLAERPEARGLAVPSMPLGSPGMEGPRKDPFDVFLVRADGSASVYRHYAAG
jgi:hypothetical protein